MSNKPKFITVQISEELYITLVNLANEYGKRPADFAETAIEHGLDAMLTDGFLIKNKTVELWQFHARVTKRLKAYKILVDAATHLSRMPDEVDFEELERVANSYNFSINQIIKDATSVSPTLIDVNDDTQVSFAVSWLLQHIEVQQDYSAKEMRILYEKEGLTEWAIKEARRILGIKSIKKAGKWYWVKEVYPVQSIQEIDHEQ